MKLSNVLFILISLFWSFTANASIVTIDFTATADRVSFLSVAPPGVSVGSSLNGRFTFDTSDLQNGDLQFQIGSFNTSSSSAFIGINTSTGEFFTSTVDDGPTETYFDEDHKNFFGPGITGDTIPHGNVSLFLEEFTIDVSDPSGAAFDIDNLIGLPTSLNSFANARFNANLFILEPVGFFANISGTLDSVTVSNVPLPASFWLMGTAVIGVFGFFRKQKKVAI